jgi:prepilin-type N-terminal cleavage/methylation domain-containing protein
MPHPMRHAGAPRGFTLLEMLVALSAASILSGIAAVHVPGLIAGWRLDAAARQVAVDIRQARMMAVYTGRSHRLHFTFASPQYSIEREEDGGGFDHVSRRVSLPSGIQITACTAPGTSFTFRPRGGAATFGTVTLTYRNGRQRRVIVDLVGRVRIA